MNPKNNPLPPLPPKYRISWSAGELKAAFTDALALPEHRNKVFIRFTSRKGDVRPHAWVFDKATNKTGVYDYDPATRKITLLRNVGF